MKTSVYEMLELDYEYVSQRIEDFIRNYVHMMGKDGVIVGLSGGLDSSTVATLSVRALGSDRVFGLLMPERDSETQNIRDAKRLASKLKIKYEVLDITSILRKMGIYDILPDIIVKDKKLFTEKLREAYRVSVFEHKAVDLPIIDPKSFKGDYSFTLREKSSDIEMIDIKSGRRGYCFTFPKVRLRSIMLYFHACLKRLLVAGTINKSEYVTSTYDEHGDGACEIAPLRNLYKTQVRQLAKYIKIPKKILNKPSTPDLILGSIITDEALIGIKYETLDPILYCLEQGMNSSLIAENIGVNEEIIKRVENTLAMAKFREDMPFAAPL
ncbi:MAG: NAD(+) synthase [Candidatus Lokiarchaeia archaeon]